MNKGLLIVGAIALLWVVSTHSATAATPGGQLDLTGLEGALVVSADAQNRINTLYNSMLQNGLTMQQIYFMLAQILFETGLLTDVANFTRMNQNNYAGLTTTSGGYASYNSIDDFMTAYIGFLTKGSNPLGASSLTDFNNRLVQNHYYTENPSVYLNGLQTYYTLLTNQ